MNWFTESCKSQCLSLLTAPFIVVRAQTREHFLQRKQCKNINRGGENNATHSTPCCLRSRTVNCVMCAVALSSTRKHDDHVDAQHKNPMNGWLLNSSRCSCVDASTGSSCCRVENNTTSQILSRTALVTKMSKSSKLFTSWSTGYFCRSSFSINEHIFRKCFLRGSCFANPRISPLTIKNE